MVRLSVQHTFPAHVGWAFQPQNPHDNRFRHKDNGSPWALFTPGESRPMPGSKSVRATRSDLIRAARWGRPDFITLTEVS